MLKLFFRFLFWLVCSLFLILFAVTSANAQVGNLTNTFNASQFQGSDVGTKVTKAQQACLADTAVPCVIIIDPILAVYSTGTLPARCSNCLWLDYRVAGNLGITAATIGSINTTPRLVDQESGGDMCAKLSACIANLPAGGGICDARGLQGAQSCAATVNCNKSNVTMLLGNVLLTGPASGNIFTLSSDWCALWGTGKAQSYLILNNGTGHGVDLQAEYQSVRDLQIITKSGITRTAGAGVHGGDPANPTGAPAAYAEISNVGSYHNYYGFWFDGGSCVNCIGLTSSLAHAQVTAGGNAQAGFKTGPASTCCVTSGNVTNSIFSDDWADAGIVIDSYTDSWNYIGLQMSCGSNATNVHILDSLAAYKPTLINFNSGSLESCGTGSTFVLDACHECTITNMQIGSAAPTSNNGLLINSAGVKSLKFVADRVASYNLECVKITGSSATDIDISHSRFGDCGKLANNTYDSINVAAGISGLIFDSNTFAGVLDSPPANVPRNNINIATGAGDNILISGNRFGNNSGTAVVQGAAGANVRLLGNVGASYGLGDVTGTIALNRILATKGSPIVAGDVGTLTGWGNTATVGLVVGTDTAGFVQINCAGTGQTASPTFVLTFHDGTFATAPIVLATRNDSSAGTYTPTISTSGNNATFKAQGLTCTAGSSYAMYYMAMGRP